MRGPGTPLAVKTKYDLLKEWNEQPFGAVGSLWIARPADDEDGVACVLLRAHRHLAKRPELVEAFLIEARSALSFRHAKAAALLDVLAGEGELQLVSEHVEGESLAAILAAADGGRLPAPVVLRIALDALEALAAAHLESTPLVHGELASQQIRLAPGGVAKVVGLGVARGVARLVPPAARGHERLAFAAPERVRTMANAAAPAELVKPGADVFAMGVVIWEAIAGQRLFAARMEAAVIDKVLNAPAPTLASMPGVSIAPAVDAVVQRALDKHPARRFRNAGELRAALEDAAGSGIATHAQVAAIIDALAGEATAQQRAEVDAAMALPASRSSAPLSVRSTAPLSVRSAAPLSVRSAAPLSTRTPYGALPRLHEAPSGDAPISVRAPASVRVPRPGVPRTGNRVNETAEAVEAIAANAANAANAAIAAAAAPPAVEPGSTTPTLRPAAPAVPPALPSPAVAVGPRSGTQLDLDPPPAPTDPIPAAVRTGELPRTPRFGAPPLDPWSPGDQAATPTAAVRDVRVDGGPRRASKPVPAALLAAAAIGALLLVGVGGFLLGRAGPSPMAAANGGDSQAVLSATTPRGDVQPAITPSASAASSQTVPAKAPPSGR